MIKRSKIIFLIFFMLIPSTLLSCKAISGNQSGKRHIAATHEVAANIAKMIGSDFVTVTSIIKPGSDPHSYKANENDMIRVAGAEIILYNGYFLEGRLAEILRTNDKTSSTISLTSGLEKESLIRSSERHFVYDPHFWMDVTLYSQAVRHTTDKLVSVSPINERLYRKNEEQYLQKLITLQADMVTILSSVPENKRILVTTHDAFKYFGKTYGFKTFSLQGIDTSKEVRTDNIATLIKIITDNSIDAIFFEATIPKRVYEQVESAMGVLGREVKVIGPLYSDSLMDAAEGEDAYITTMLYNAKTIADALTLPPAPATPEPAEPATPEPPVQPTTTNRPAAKPATRTTIAPTQSAPKPRVIEPIEINNEETDGQKSTLP